MKYPQLVSTPSAVSDWLEDQLEARGIDSLVYTRYILSLFHWDSSDIYRSECDNNFDLSEKELKRSGSRKRLRRSNEADLDEIKRLVAIECLMSASDQNCGIESLVDELWQRLKEQASNESIEKTLQPKATRDRYQDLARQYYIAFPALSGEKVPAQMEEKKKSARKCLTYDDASNKEGPTYWQLWGPGKGEKKDWGGYWRGSGEEVDDDWGIGWLGDEVPRNSWMKDIKAINLDDFPRKPTNDQSLETSADPWNEEDYAFDMYDANLLCEIRDLLDSPDVETPKDVELMRTRESANSNSYEFVPYGSNISSIWSTHAVDVEAENIYNLSVASDMLGEEFSSISIGGQGWFDNERNNMLEGFVDDELPNLENLWNARMCEKWSEPESFNSIAQSLLMLNHDKETSSFVEVTPGSIPSTRVQKQPVAYKKPEESSEKDKEDLYLTSSRSYFKPIIEKPSKPKATKYENGTIFFIPNNLDVVNYTRSDSGKMCVESEWGSVKKYMEYYEDKKYESDFVLKFSVCQNDKDSQTDSEDEAFLMENFEEEKIDEGIEKEAEDKTMDESSVFQLENTPEDGCKCIDNPHIDDSIFESCPVHYYRPSSLVAEFLWKGETERCEKCNNDYRNTETRNSRKWYTEQAYINYIWSGVVCKSCLGTNEKARPIASSKDNSQLWDDIKYDGEKLLSDLRNIHQNVVEEHADQEVPHDIVGFINNKDRKRRHSFVTGLIEGPVSAHQGDWNCWNFAVSMKQNCLNQMSQIPTLRSVTL